MPTANEELRNAFVRNQVFLMQSVETISDDVVKILDKSEKDLIEQVRKQTARGEDRLTRANTVRLKRLQASVTDIRGSAWKKVEKTWASEGLDLMTEQQEFLASSFETVSPVVVDVTLVAPQLLKSLTKNHPIQGKVLGDWSKQLAAADIARIMDQVKIGMVQGEGPEQIARRIVGTAGLRGRNGVTQISRRNARAITRTMVNDFSNQANQEFFQENRDLIQFEVYTATLDSRTTPVCQSLDGKRFPVGEGAVPPLHFACRSVRIPVLDPDSLIGVERPFKASSERQLLKEFTRKNKLKPVTSRARLPRGFKGKFDQFARKRGKQLTGTVPANLTYEQWLRTQSIDFQEQVLGKAKAKLFREGGLSLDKFVDPRFKPVRLKDLRSLNKEAFKKAGLSPVSALEARKLGVGARVEELIQEGLSNQEILDIIKQEIPGANTTSKSIAWYRSKLKKQGINPRPRPIAAPKPKPKAPPPVADPGDFKVQRNKAVVSEMNHVTTNPAVKTIKNPGEKQVRKLYEKFQKDMDALEFQVHPKLFNIQDSNSQLRIMWADTERLREGAPGAAGAYWPGRNMIGLKSRGDYGVFIHEYFHHLDYAHLRGASARSIGRGFGIDNLRPGLNDVRAGQLRSQMIKEMEEARRQMTKTLVNNPDLIGDKTLRKTVSNIKDGKFESIDYEKHWDALFRVPVQDVPRPSNYSLHSPEEWIAEAGKLFFTNRDKLRVVAPKTHDAIEALLKGEVF